MNGEMQVRVRCHNAPKSITEARQMRSEPCLSMDHLTGLCCEEPVYETKPIAADKGGTPSPRAQPLCKTRRPRQKSVDVRRTGVFASESKTESQDSDFCRGRQTKPICPQSVPWLQPTPQDYVRHVARNKAKFGEDRLSGEIGTSRVRQFHREGTLRKKANLKGVSGLKSQVSSGSGQDGLATGGGPVVRNKANFKGTGSQAADRVKQSQLWEG